MLRDLFEKRAISYQTLFAAGDDIEITSNSGTKINPDTAFQINAIFSAVSLISDTISTLPLDAYRRVNGNRFPLRPKPDWVNRPDLDTTREAFYGQAIVSLLLDGNAFIRVFTKNGEIVNMTVLNPQQVKIERASYGEVRFKVEGEKRPLTPEEVIHIPDVVRPGSLRGVSRVDALKENFGLAMALENYAAKFFGQGATTQGIIEFPEELTAEQAKQLAQSFDSRHKGWGRAHKTGVLSAGAKYRETSVNNDQAQFIDSRRMAVEDVARAFNVPPHLLGLPGTNSYASVEQNNLAWVTHCLRPIIQKIENALSPLLALSPNGTDAFIKFNIDGLLRADINSRMSAYSTGLQSGFLTINDVRRLEDLRIIPDASADTVRVPLANVDVQASTINQQDRRVAMVARLVQVGYDPAEALAAMGLPEIAHTGVPSVQLQNLANLDPEDPQATYEVE
jgi:HK97 family phage portal protein